MKKLVLAVSMACAMCMNAQAQQAAPPDAGQDADSVISVPPKKVDVARGTFQDSALNGGSPGRTKTDSAIKWPSYCEYDKTRPGCADSGGGAGGTTPDTGTPFPDDLCLIEVITAPGHAAHHEECR